MSIGREGVGNGVTLWATILSHIASSRLRRKSSTFLTGPSVTYVAGGGADKDWGERC